MKGKSITKWARRARIDTLIDIECRIKEKKASGLDADAIVKEIGEYVVSERVKIIQQIEDERLHPKEARQ